MVLIRALEGRQECNPLVNFSPCLPPPDYGPGIAVLESHGIDRLYKEDLAEPLTDGQIIQTGLRRPPHKQWDALFI